MNSLRSGGPPKYSFPYFFPPSVQLCTRFDTQSELKMFLALGVSGARGHFFPVIRRSATSGTSTSSPSYPREASTLGHLPYMALWLKSIASSLAALSHLLLTLSCRYPDYWAHDNWARTTGLRLLGPWTIGPVTIGPETTGPMDNCARGQLGP